jgi:hypothetical protein
MWQGMERLEFGHDSEYFWLHRIRAHVPLQPVVFQNTKVAKMNNALPLHLFSQCTTYPMFAEAFETEFFVFFPRFLMISALSYREHSTKTRCSLLETVFWLLWLYQALLTSGNIPPLLCFRTAEGGRAPLYTAEQIMHALREYFGTPIGSRIQISADSDTCPGNIDLGFSAAGHKSKNHADRFF